MIALALILGAFFHVHAADPPPPAPKIAMLTKAPVASSFVDVVPGRAPSAEFPGGTVYVAGVFEAPSRPDVMLYEWDVTRARTVVSKVVDLSPAGMVDPGTPKAVHLARAGNKVFIATESEGGYADLHINSWHDGAAFPSKVTVLPHGRQASIAANEAFFVVAARQGTSKKLDVTLFMTLTVRWREVAHVQLDGDEIGKDQRPGDVAFMDGRLYVVTRPKPTETRLVELEVPSLKIVNAYKHERVSTKHNRSQITARNHTLSLLDRGELVELDADLRERARREMDADELP